MNGAKHRFALGLTCFFLIGITVVYPFLLYTPNAFVTRWREWYIETAMGTMTHQWLATWFIPENIINEVMTKRYLMNQKQEGIVSNWDGAWEEKEEDTAETPKNKFYAMFSELDESEFERFLADNPEYLENGYDEIVRLWSPILDEFKANGIKFALEVHPGEIAFDYYSTEKLLKKFADRPEFGLNFDPSHLLWQGVTPHLFLRDFMDRVYHVHMKDAAVTLDGRSGLLGSHIDFGDLRRGWNFRSLGHGDVNFEEIIRVLPAYHMNKSNWVTLLLDGSLPEEEIIRLLNAAGYDGPLSVEWEDSGMDRIEGATEAAAFVKKVDFKKSDVKFDDAIAN